MNIFLWILWTWVVVLCSVGITGNNTTRQCNVSGQFKAGNGDVYLCEKQIKMEKRNVQV